MSEKEYILEMKGVSKSFPGVKALDNVSLKVKKGTVHALMGENGAGKSTLMKCLFGIYSPDSGEIFFDGKQVSFKDTRDAMETGISMIHQELHPIRTRNVMENLWVGRIPYKQFLGIKWVDSRKMLTDTLEQFKKLNIDINPREMTGELSSAHCQLIEIVRAVSFKAKVIIMDEPTSSLSDNEVEILFNIIEMLTKQGVAIIYISHKIEEILRISDNVTVLRDGQLVGSWLATEMTQDMIINKMVGRQMTNRYPEKKISPGEDYLVVENLTSALPNSFKNISFNLRKGEILGIGGLVGAQRTELVESIFGLRPIAGGSITINGKKVKIGSPKQAIHHGIALLTEERRVNGIIPMLSVLENMVLAKQTATPKEYTGGKFLLDNSKRKKDTQEYIDFFAIKTPNEKVQIQYLSGGNQQKVLLAKWMLTTPDILILDEPTRGIDVGAKYEIYSLIAKMAEEGKCVIMVSSEMPELMGMSDRIMVMYEGKLSGIIDGKTATDEEIMRLASYHGVEGD